MEPIRVDFRDQIASNKRMSFFLIAGIFAVIVIFGYVISMAFEPGYFFLIMIVSIVFSISYIVLSYYNSDKIAIASVGAKKARRDNYREYYRLVEGLTIASGMPMPRLYVMHSPAINAFASGRDPNHAVVCVTDGALEKLEKRELEGVLAHELGHIASYDMRYMTIVAVMVGMIAIIAQIFLRSLWFRSGNNSKGNAIFIVIGIVMAILAPIVVHLVQMSISRKREFVADANAVKFTRYPDGLIGAFKKIQHDNTPVDKKVSKAVSHLFFTNPFKGIGSTHPPLEKRIAILERM
jgi:heat shock protein HtpX